jgi:hypothetical protein
LVVGSAAFAQQGTQPAPGPAVPAPGIPDTNAPVPAPAIPEPTPTPGVDPNALQSAPATPDLGQPANGTPAPAPAKPKKAAAPALPTLRGTIGSIDKNAMTVTIHGKSKDETLNITSKTHIFADGKPAILADGKEGENVVAEYRNNKEKGKDALSLRFGGAAAPEHKAEAKPAAKKSSKKSTAKKKGKKTSATDSAAPAPVPDATGVTPLPGTPEPAVPTPVPGATIPGPGTPVPAPGTPGNP